MTEKNKSDRMTNTAKPVPMKLFAAWEVDRTPSNCIPRLCTLRITRLRLTGPLGEAGGGAAVGAGGETVILAARMHSSKRTLRSNDIVIPPTDVELDLCFSLQYPHFVKRDGNRLQIMLQRRKKYKNRTILGYKTLAEGVIRMDQVLQRSMDMELELHPLRGKGGGAGAGAGAGAGPGGQPVARLSITGLASTPVDHDTKNNNTLLINERGYSDEEEEGEFSSMEEADDVTYGERARRRTHCRQLEFNKTDMSYTKLSRSRYLSRDRDSDSEQEAHRDMRKSSHSGREGKMSQRNLKQKFAALLRRFKVPEDMTERGAVRDTHNAQRDIDELFQELDSLSCGEESGPEQMDTISIGSTPKPSLRPFFSSSRSLANQKHHRHSNAIPSPIPYMNKVESPAATQSDVLACAVIRHASLTATSELTSARDRLPTGAESDVQRSSAGDERASEGNSDGDIAGDLPALGTSPKDNKTARHLEQVQQLLAAEPETVGVCCGAGPGPGPGAGPGGAGAGPGGAAAVAAALQGLSVPTLCATDANDARELLHALYSACAKLWGVRRGPARVALCGGEAAVAACLRAHVDLAPRRAPDAAPHPRLLLLPIGANTAARYLGASDAGYGALFGDTWGAALERADFAELSLRINRYLNSVGGVNNVPIGEAMLAYREDAGQTFVPFISEVRVRCSCDNAPSLEGEEAGAGAGAGRGSPPATPDAAPHEPADLQIDYWLAEGAEGGAGAGAGACAGAGGGGGGGGVTPGGKVTVKAPFRALLVTRRNAHLALHYHVKEKKQKIMRLGKKREKGSETADGRTVSVEGVSRLICSIKHGHAPLRVYIDGVEWSGVKFFQLSTQWQSHVKTFPVATSGAPLAPHEN